jgi:hypothetical protein
MTMITFAPVASTLVIGLAVMLMGTAIEEALDKKDRKMFDEMMSYPHIYNAAGVTAGKPVPLQPILMSIIFEHYKQLDTIHRSVEK